MQKVKTRENLKSGKRREAVSYPQGSSHKSVSRFLNRNILSQKGLARSIQSDAKQEPTTKIILPSKAIIWIEWKGR